MELTRHDVARRQAEFPEMIRQIGWNDVIIGKYIELYSHGAIVSKEEAYCQMIRELSVSYNEMFKRLVDEAHMKTILYVKP